MRQNLIIKIMSGIFLLVLVLVAIVYLMYAMLYPEKF
ncbi:MAG TPA: potassium-transporting ATPase subunit F [Candidatus Kapabacteria bacterium]